jgi:hypothetical protein
MFTLGLFQKKFNSTSMVTGPAITPTEKKNETKTYL